MELDSGRILPRGAVGELCFGGAQVFRGYLKMPELNERKTINHAQYGRIYRSGDMGMLLPDDSILFTGRSDDQVKIRGLRVELGEITSKILDHAEVEDCVTLLFRTNEARQRLVVFWVPKGTTKAAFELLAPAAFAPLVSDIFEALASQLPTYMVPTHIVPITRIPLTTQGKTDKRLLFSSYKALSSEYLHFISYNASDNNDCNTLSDEEKKIAEALAETTQTTPSDITRTSSFFSLGLDSVSAIQFSRKLRDAGFGDVSVSVVLKNATIARLAAICGHRPGQPIPRHIQPDRKSTRLNSSHWE